MADFATKAFPPNDPDAPLAVRLRLWALEAGFAEAGVVALPYAAEALDGQRFEQWIREGRGGTMAYLSRATELGELLRKRVETPFPWARSVVVCWTPYAAAGPRSIDAAPEGAGWIARYAWSSRIDPQRGLQPSDYHKVLLKRLRTLEARLRGSCGEMEARAFVDTGPVVERSLAIAAGLGWRGKNTCLIHPKLGSYGFLAVLLTSLELTAQTNVPAHPEPCHSERKAAEVPPFGEFSTVRNEGSESNKKANNQNQILRSAPEDGGKKAQSIFALTPDRCGSCTRCIEACPTGALTEPYQMDASRCIAYLTIEHKGAIEEELMEGMGRQIFGCDICQEVCPWNRKPPIATDADLQPRSELINPALKMLAALDETEYARLFDGSPARRTGFPGLQRNLAVAMGNSGLRSFIPKLEEWSEAVDVGLRSAAQWALKKLAPSAPESR